MEANKQRAEKLALQYEFDSVEFYSQWKGCAVFVAERNTQDDTPCIGYPTFIVVNDSSARFASSEETLRIMGIKPIKDVDYSGENL